MNFTSNRMTCEQIEQKRRRNLVRIEIENALKRLGISPDTDGFALLTMAVQIWIDETEEDDTGLPPQLTKVIYPALSSLTGKSVSSIERNIRYAIERAMGSAKRLEFATRAFGMGPDPEKSCYTNGQFIALLAMMLRSFGGVGPAA